MNRSLITLLQVLTIASSAHSMNDLGYHECTYNTYRAVCLDSTNSLNSDNHRLTEFPAIAGRTCVLLRNNQISRFPENLEGTETVRTLNLQNNRISELPVDLRPMETLEILDLSRNWMTTLSPRTRFPVSLRGLLVAGNKMKTIPAGIEIPGLFVFDLSNNLFESVPEHFCVSDQLFRVDLTSNPMTQDLSLSFNILNRCRNIRKIPYCLFTDKEQLSCDCPTLAQVVAQKQTFCMGTPFRGREMKCKQEDSSEEYQGKYISDVNATEIKSACSYALQKTPPNGSDKMVIELTSLLLFVGLFASGLV